MREEAQFTQMLRDVFKRHVNVVPAMASGVLIMKRQLVAAGIERGDAADFLNHCPYMSQFLDRFYSSRLTLRMMIQQHVESHDRREGIVHPEMVPADVVRGAIDEASRICEGHYGIAPDVNVYGDLRGTMTYIPMHLHYMTFELLKNSMRACVETHGADSLSLPEIDIVVAVGDEDTVIKVSDQGGGISRAAVDQIWSYLHTTVENAEMTQEQMLQLTLTDKGGR
jgi:pyruvate dehydrogenase kinase 2/3/4